MEDGATQRHGVRDKNGNVEKGNSKEVLSQMEREVELSISWL